MLHKEPATHKQILRHLTTTDHDLKLYQIGIRYHHNTYTPETAYFVSLDGKGKKFTGSNTFNAYMRAVACYEATAADLDPQYFQNEKSYTPE